MSDTSVVNEEMAQSDVLSGMRMRRQNELQDEYQRRFQLVARQLRSSQAAVKTEQLVDTLRQW